MGRQGLLGFVIRLGNVFFFLLLLIGPLLATGDCTFTVFFLSYFSFSRSQSHTEMAICPVNTWDDRGLLLQMMGLRQAVCVHPIQQPVVAPNGKMSYSERTTHTRE
jgi:hypothetical protein